MSRAQKFIPQSRLDLHGMNLEQAFSAFDKFLKSARKNRKTKLLIIHGVGSGIMSENVYKWCDSLLYPYILEYKQAPIELGGHGAIILTIEKQKEKK